MAELLPKLGSRTSAANRYRRKGGGGMRDRWRFLPAIAVAITIALVCVSGCGDSEGHSGRGGDSPHRVFVILGFHGNFYHSWRGDTSDEAGFGQDIRIVREILSILDDANARGLDARGYWDFENLFTYERILPEHAPDIIEGIRRRVHAHGDEILLMPYDNGLIHAMTERELRTNLRWAISNPWGSGARDLFGEFTPILRPQETTLTTGILPILEEEGIEGLALLYAGVPFNGFSNFVPVLPVEQQYGATWLRLREEGPRMLLLHSAGIADIVDHVSMEKWLLDLRALQTSGRVDQDLVIHINADADGDFWLPQNLPPGIGWFPNAGGLSEHIEAVNRYEWAQFTTPAAYLADHPPTGEVLVRQDLADGAFDGQYSWAEKFSSHSIWTVLEQSRLASQRAEALARGASEAMRAAAHALLWEGRDSSFFARIEGLSTTHFGMSTPIVNEERQAVAERVTGRARDRAIEAERLLAADLARHSEARNADALYRFEVRDVREPKSAAGRAHTLVRLPVIFDGDIPVTRLATADGKSLAHWLVNRERLAEGRVAAELWTALLMLPGEIQQLRLHRAAQLREVRASGEAIAAPGHARPKLENRTLSNGIIEVELAHGTGIVSLRSRDAEIGGEDFLSSFISYRSDDEAVIYPNAGWKLISDPANGEGGLGRARLRADIPFETPEDGRVEVTVEVVLTLLPDGPGVVADVEVTYPYTTKRDVLHNPSQKLRRYLDLRWVEVAPFQLHPQLVGTREAPLRVWKHNYLDVTSHYDLDYARINAKNAELEAFNHQVTAGWVAVSDHQQGLLLSTDADVRASFAFAPMRLREVSGQQALWLNPFGSYFGPQLDYSHLGGTGVGKGMTELFSASLRPNGPSYNGKREDFSLLLAPYSGDAPPAQLRAAANAFFAAPAVAYLEVPAAAGSGVHIADDLRTQLKAERRRIARHRDEALPVPRAFLVNPTSEALDVVWDEPSDPRIDGYEIAWRAANDKDESDWHTERIAPARRHRLAQLSDGDQIELRLRAFGAGQQGAWTSRATVTVGPVEVVEMTDVISEMSFGLLLRYVGAALEHAWATW
ncbi:MAG: hypothetical protein GY733_06195 [bacterium]|nr:hypothetical protein [bacterium]